MTDASPVLLLARDLIRKPSVTPADEGAMDVVEKRLEALGFRCRRMSFNGVENLYARRGEAGPNLCFAGHTDVVPAGDIGAWRVDPFAAEVEDGVLVGRGAVDMKGAIACWIGAVEETLAAGEGPKSLSLIITGDEEGRGVDGTRRVVEALMAEGERVDHCVVGEPSSVARVGDVIKIGRRGSLNVWITVKGRQGHVAYPERGANPIPVLLDLLQALRSRPLDQPWPSFTPSNLEITTVDVGNPATNVIPARAFGRFNIRFNPAHTGEALMAWITREVEASRGRSGLEIELDMLHSGDAFLTEPSRFTGLVAAAIEDSLGVTPEPNTIGGTSDARYIRAMCPVVEFGLVGQTMHQVDERVSLSDLDALTRAYRAIIAAYGAAFA